MKRLLTIIFFLCLLIGALISAMKWLEIGPFKQDPRLKKAKAVVAKPDTTVFVDMEPLALPIFQGNRVAATVQIQIKLETTGQKKADQVKKMMPVITDAFIRDLHGFLPRLLKQEQRIDVLVLKQRLQMVTDRITGRGLVKNVLVQSVIDQPR